MELREDKHFTVTFALGLEGLARAEVTALGGAVSSEADGALSFAGTLETAYRLCLWSRYASRVLMPLGSSFPAKDGEDLRKAAFALPWEQHFGPDDTIATECSARFSDITNTHYAALCVKDGIADRFTRHCGRRPSVDTRQPDIRVHLFLEEDRGILSLDLSGDALHRRGYRTSTGEAPLKESLAAAIVAFSGAVSEGDVPGAVIDPMCGSGTLLIEAALMRADVAPGLLRPSYGFMRWRGHDQGLWDRTLQEARARRDAALARPFARIFGYDASAGSIGEALGNIRRAGLSGLVHVERRELAFLAGPPGREPEAAMTKGLIVVNPPYGERLGDAESLPYLYRCLGRKLRERFPCWTAGVFTAQDAPADALGMEPSKRHRLFNGAIPCILHVFHLPSSPPEGSPAKRRPSPATPQTGRGELADRLRKNLRIRAKWALREAITCYRLYDADLPQYNAAIDLYEGRVRIREYRAPADMPRGIAADHMKIIITTVREVLGVGRNRVFIVRAPVGGAASQRAREPGILHEIGEDGCRFLVDLSDPGETGLPLEQRSLRRMVRGAARDKRFLNLFCGSGAATVRAAMGGARASVSVDASPHRIRRAQKNLLLNGLSEERHRLVAAEPMEWISAAREGFDLIFADVTGRCSSAGGRQDAPLDHADLLSACATRLEKGGMLIVVSRDRRFMLGKAAIQGSDIQEITRSTIPPDFARTPRIHRVWRIVRL